MHEINTFVNEFVSSLRRIELSFILFQNCTHHNFQETQQKNYFNVKIYKFIILLKTLNKTLKSIIIRRISSLMKIHDMFLASQMSDRKSRNYVTTLKLFIEQIHTI